jgi:hypothetical protein
MARKLTVLFRRDRSKDRLHGNIVYEGYEILWPDGRRVAVGLDAFCRHGQRLLGLGKHLEGRPERLIGMICFPLANADQDMTRLPGHRVRRFFLERRGSVGRIHFMDGTPTSLTFQLGQDEPGVLQWIGLAGLEDGGREWFDLAASPEPASTQSRDGVLELTSASDR